MHIEPGRPSDSVTQAVDSKYKKWLPDQLVQGRTTCPGSPAGTRGATRQERAQDAQVLQHCDTDHACCTQEVIAGTRHQIPLSALVNPGAILAQSLRDPSEPDS